MRKGGNAIVERPELNLSRRLTNRQKKHDPGMALSPIAAVKLSFSPRAASMISGKENAKIEDCTGHRSEQH